MTEIKAKVSGLSESVRISVPLHPFETSMIPKNAECHFARPFTTTVFGPGVRRATSWFKPSQFLSVVVLVYKTANNNRFLQSLKRIPEVTEVELLESQRRAASDWPPFATVDLKSPTLHQQELGRDQEALAAAHHTCQWYKLVKEEEELKGRRELQRRGSLGFPGPSPRWAQ